MDRVLFQQFTDDSPDRYARRNNGHRILSSDIYRQCFHDPFFLAYGIVQSKDRESCLDSVHIWMYSRYSSLDRYRYTFTDRRI